MVPQLRSEVVPLTRRVAAQISIRTVLKALSSSHLLTTAGALAALIAVGATAAHARSDAPGQPATPDSSSISVSVPQQQAKVGTAYNVLPVVKGGSAPYFFGVLAGILPPGLTLNPRTGSISGTPTAAGEFSFTLFASDLRLLEWAITPVRIVVIKGGSGTVSTIKISPTNATIASQGTGQFAATISGTSNTAVLWSSTAGSISPSGRFTAPRVGSRTTITVTATSQQNSSLSASATVVVTPEAAALAITTSSVTGATAGSPYSVSFSANGGTLPYHWTIAAGTLPAGIQLQSASGILAGTTSLSGSFHFSVKVSDSAGATAAHDFELVSSASSNQSGNFDGPAELPRTLIQTAMSDTPAPGSSIAVKSGSDLQSALDRASCGDTLELQAGATFTGQFTFPARSCDDNHWIIVRTSASDAALPPEGSRLTPCYAGVASLPGRPALNCSSTANVLAKLVMPTSAVGPIVFASGANHYRFVGLEITRTPGTGIVYSLASLRKSGTINNVIFDRVWLHGSAQDETKRGVELAGASFVSVVDSSLTDFHCTASSGACTDAAAIAGGQGNPVGPFKIVNNFLEASGENILFGGAQSATTPSDIEIRQNHFFKPLTWMRGQPGQVSATDGNAFIVKNFLELKNAQRVLVEGNIMENTWGGFSQKGYAIVLTPKNQASGGGNICPNCLVSDVTIRFNTISHVGGGLQIANALSDNGGVALDGERYSIHDVTIDDIDLKKYNGTGHFAEVETDRGAPLVRSVAINHVTAFPPSGLFTIGGDPQAKMSDFSFDNSLVTVGSSPVWSIGGGTANCAFYDKPLTTFTACFSQYSFTNNALIATPSEYPLSSWPRGNAFPASISAVGFVNYNGGNGGDYHLLPSSPFKSAGTDGKDLGADIDAIQAATAGVY